MDMSKYEDFTGVLIKRSRLLFRPKLAVLTLRNKEKTVQVNMGRAGAMLFTLGQELQVGHIGRLLINVQPAESE